MVGGSGLRIAHYVECESEMQLPHLWQSAGLSKPLELAVFFEFRAQY
jgi:hypothetical protein